MGRLLVFQLKSVISKFQDFRLNVAAELRFQRIQDSIATNPEFYFVSPRYFTAYGESVFPFLFFVDGRVSDGQLDLTVARGFFQNSTMPDGFFRAKRSIDEINDFIVIVFSAHPTQPGENQGDTNNYVFDLTSDGLKNSVVETDVISFKLTNASTASTANHAGNAFLTQDSHQNGSRKGI